MSMFSAMKTAEDQVKIGDFIYMFLTPTLHRIGNTDCIIFGHAGLATKLNLPPFQIPDNVTLHFYTQHGQPHYTKPTRPLGWKGIADEDIRSGGTSYNYVVLKGLGHHWTHGAKCENDPASYADVRRAMDGAPHWHPHYVTVRNRRGLSRGAGYCSLKDIIDNVLAFSKSLTSGISPITDFYFAGCRAVHTNWRPR